MRTITKLLVVLALALLPVGLSSQATLPAPDSVFGFTAGADNKLATYDQSVTYFRKLAAAAPKNMIVEEAGKTSQGRTYVFALISSAENLAKIDRYREIARRLAHPAGLSEAEARALVAEGKAFVHIDGGLHSTEVAGHQMTPLLAYDVLRRASEPKFKAILDNCILMLWPTINPDGQQMVAESYMTTGQMTNVLYQEYVGHDNNRDAYMMNMVESRVMEFTWRQWEPDIIYVHHQSSPFPTRIWLPPFAPPIANDAPYLMSSELNMIGMAIAKGLDEEGKVGATHMGQSFDAWYPGYVDYQPVFKNIPAFWTETQGTGPAPRTTTLDQIPPNMRVPQPMYPSPWLGTTWHLRDAVDYMETASIAVLDYAAKYKESLLMDRYKSGVAQIERGRTGAPYAYFVTENQPDPVAPVELLRRLAFAGVRVSQLQSPVTVDDTTYPAGTWVVPTDQEFAASAREVLDVQKYPDVRQSPGGPLEQPYDAAGWTLPFQFGVKVTTAKTPLTDAMRAQMKPLGPALDPKAKPVAYNLTPSADAAPFDSVPGIGFDASPAAAAIVPLPGKITGSGSALLLDPAENNTFRALYRAWKEGGSVRYLAPSRVNESRYVITGLSASAQDDLVKTLALQAERGDSATAGIELRKPRVALYNSPSSQDDGWTRWVLEQYGIEYTPIAPANFPGTSPLADRFDVVIVTSDGGSAFGGGGGGRGGRGGGAAAPAGAPSPSQEERIKAVTDFVNAGGTVVCFNRASAQAVSALKLPVTVVAVPNDRLQFFVGGSILQINVDNTQRVMAGMPGQAGVFFDSGPIFETGADFKGAVLAKYQDSGSPLMSGYLVGEKFFNGKAAALDVELGAGHVVLFGFRPQWRGQPFGDFKMIFNAALRGR